jgi:hypothetical protein
MSQDDRPGAGKVISLFGGAPPPAAAPVVLPPEEGPPPLGEIPEPPRFQDPRQLRSRNIIRSTTAQLGRRGGGPVVNLETGWGAAGVNLGELQDLLEKLISSLDHPSLMQRWEDEVDDHLTSAIFQWVQRVKELEMMVEDEGVHIELITQDDHGAYAYHFDVFPGREF